MKVISRITSNDNKRYIEIVETREQVFKLRQFVVKFDKEESVECVVRERPDPPSIFSNELSAEKEAEALLQQTPI
jgi:hypothetical protein